MSHEQARDKETRLGIRCLAELFMELAQMPLYADLEDYNAGVFWHCFVASLGDGVMVLLIVGTGWIMLKRGDWFERPGIAGYVIMREPLDMVRKAGLEVNTARRFFLGIFHQIEAAPGSS